MRNIKDKKISIIGYKTTKNEYGENEKVKEYLLRDIWAYVRQLSSQETFEQAQIHANSELVFIVNFNDKLKNPHKLIDYEVEFKKDTYSITKIDYFEFEKQDIKIYAKLNKDK